MNYAQFGNSRIKKIVFLSTLFILLGVHMNLQAQNDDKKILIAYFSRTGNTRTVAEYIHQAVGGDIFEIRPVRVYPEEYRPTTVIAREELDTNARPGIIENVSNMAQYDIIFLGYPNWWNTMPMFFFTFLESHDLSGKTIIPFCTHGGSGLGRSVTDIRSLAPNATIRDGLAISGRNAVNSRNEVIAWLRRMGMIR